MFLCYRTLCCLPDLAYTLVWEYTYQLGSCLAYFTSFSRSIDFTSSPCQRQCELLPSLGVRRPLTFHILIFSIKFVQFVPIR